MSLMDQKYSIANNVARPGEHGTSTPVPPPSSKEGTKEAETNVDMPSYHSILYHHDAYHHFDTVADAHLHRAVLYRLHYKIISMETFSQWGEIFQRLNDEYTTMKEESKEFLITPKYHEQVEAFQTMTKNKSNADSVSAQVSKSDTVSNKDVDSIMSSTTTTSDMSAANDSSGEIFDIHNDVIARQLILKDMQRLFMNGIDNKYFQTEKRRNILQNVLCLWSCRNKQSSWGVYKQGMHEIAGMILFVVENEFQAFLSHNTAKCSLGSNGKDDDGEVDASWFCKNEDYIEMHTYHLFENIMFDLRVIYSANSASSMLDVGGKGDENVKTMSTFLTYIQDVVIRSLHPRLWEHFKICGIDPQLYGTSWTRLLFGRILLSNDTEQLAVWDYLFSPAVKDFPKVPFLKHNIPLGPHGSDFLGTEEDVNQFGLTDTSKTVHFVGEANGGMDPVSELASSSDENDEVDGDNSWSLGKHLLPGFQKRKSSPSKGEVQLNGGAVNESESTNVEGPTGDDEAKIMDIDNETIPVPKNEIIKDMNQEAAHRDSNNTFYSLKDDTSDGLWRDTGPLTDEDTNAHVAVADTDSNIIVDENDDGDDGDDDDDDEDDDNITDDNDEAIDEFDMIECGSYVTSEEHNVIEEEDDDDESLVEWPFAEEDLLLKIGSIIVAILFKMREVLLVSSELDTITTLLRPFEKLRDLGGNGGLKEFVFDVIRLSQQFESSVFSKCTVQPIPLHAVSDIMDFHNIRSVTYSLDVIGAPTWRDASMCIKTTRSDQTSNIDSLISVTNDEKSVRAVETEKGWYLGKYIGKMVGGNRNKSLPTSNYDSIENKMKRKRQLLRDYFSDYAATEGFSSEFSVMSDLPLHMGWLRKRKPRGPLINYNKWKRRYIVLTRETLSYYTSDNFEEKRGHFVLSPSTRAMVEDGTTEKHRLKFVIDDPFSKQKVRFFLVESDEIRRLWVSRINRAVELLKLSEEDCNLASMSTLTIGRKSDCPSSDEEEEEVEFSVDSSFCRKLIIGDNLETYHYASGWLKKKNLIGGGWRLLYFELVKDEILFYSDTTNVAAKVPLGRIQISPNTVVLSRTQGNTKHKFAIAATSSTSMTAKKLSFTGIFKGTNGITTTRAGGDCSDVNGTQSTGGTIGKKLIYVAASNASEKERWMTVIREAVELLRNKTIPTSV